MRRYLPFLLLGSLSGCCDPEANGCTIGDDPNGPVNPPAPTSFRIWGGDGQSSSAGTLLPDQISVQGTNAVGALATFTVRTGGGRVNGGTSYQEALAGPDNIAAVAWELGPDLGDQIVRVTFSGRSNYLEIQAVAHGPTAQILATRGQGQTAAPGTAVGIRPTVKITDIDGRPIPRARVDFVSQSVPWGTRTGPLGIAEMPIDWVLGTTAGNYVVTAFYTVDGTDPGILGNPVVFTAAAVPPTAIQMAKSAGDNQSAAPGAPVAIRPAVRLSDQFGNGVPGVIVTFAREENAGTLTDSVRTTDANGVAEVGGWSLGAEGTYRLTARAAGPAMTGNPATFTAMAAPPAGTPASIVVVSGNRQTGGVLTELPQRLRVRVLDATGRPVPSVTVGFATGTGSGSFPSPLGLPPIRTNAAGEAESYPWTLGRFAGLQYVLVSIPLGPPNIIYPQFDATATPGTVQRLAKLSGDGGTDLTGTGVAPQSLPQVQVLDLYDNPIAGVAITFAVTGGGGSLTGSANVVTDSRGTARPAGWVLGVTAGVNTLIAAATASPGTSITPGTVTFTKAGAAATANLLQNPGFEEAVATGSPPTQPGRWVGDATQSVTPAGFSAKDGQKVLQFVATGGAIASTSTTASQLWQLVDVSHYAALIDAGSLTMTGRAWFNRVGGATSDSLFSVRVYAFSGSPVEFAARYAAQAWLGRGIADLKTDGDLVTWEEVVSTLTLPAGTRYIAIEVIAFEDVVNDGPGTPEFLGHYADRASLVLVR